MSATDQFIGILSHLKPGELGLLRMHAGQGLDETVDGFDLFAGIWWPLRQKNEHAPKRAVAWLVAKLYAVYPISHTTGETLALQLHDCQPGEEKARARFHQKFDELLLTSLDNIEPLLRWALSLIASSTQKLDWVKLTDDLSIWERETTRLKWVDEFLKTDERKQSC